MRLGLHLPVGGNAGFHRRLDSVGPDGILGEIVALRDTFGLDVVSLHNPGLGPVMPAPIPPAWTGDPPNPVTHMRFEQRSEVIAGIGRALRDRSIMAYAYVGGPHGSKPLEFEWWQARQILQPWADAGMGIVLDHTAARFDSKDADAAKPLPGSERVVDIVRRTSWQLGVPCLVEPVSRLVDSWAQSYRWRSSSRPPGLNDLICCQKPTPGPWDVGTPEERVEWLRGESMRLAAMWPNATILLPRYLYDALAAGDPGVRAEWIAATKAAVAL